MSTRVTNYYTVGGVIEAERTSGFAGHDYIPDALGSVVATTNPTNQALRYFARYYPYGRGYNVETDSTLPGMQWVGIYGYRKTGRWHADQHVRARHYSLPEGKWNTVDPLSEKMALMGLMAPRNLLSVYEYSLSRPVSLIDPTGWDAVIGGCTTLSIPVPLFGNPSVIFRACIDCFDCVCARGPGPWATYCRQLTIGLSWSLGGVNIGQLYEELEQAKTIIGNIISIAGGLIGESVSCLGLPTPVCKKVVPGHLYFSACFEGCAIFNTVSLCLTLPGGPVFTVRTNPCGLPSIRVTIAGNYKECN